VQVRADAEEERLAKAEQGAGMLLMVLGFALLVAGLLGVTVLQRDVARRGHWSNRGLHRIVVRRRLLHSRRVRAKHLALTRELQPNFCSRIEPRTDKYDSRVKCEFLARGLVVEIDELAVHREAMRELGWRAYQPSWPDTIAYSFVWCGLFGGFSYYRTGNIVALEVAGVVAVPVCGFVRWLYPMLKHLAWGDAE
jgi:hypothetical protein